MTKFMYVALVQMTVLFIMQVSTEPCNDEFIKEMIVKVCGMEGIKRSLPADNVQIRSSQIIGCIPGMDISKTINGVLFPMLNTLHKDKSKGGDAEKAANITDGVMQVFRECCINKNCTLSDLYPICEKK